MSSRLEIELTSTRPDGTWTWRKAGAKLPKGELDGAKLPPGASVGDVLRADADIMVDGVDILAVLPPKAAKAPRHETLVVEGTRRDEALVTTVLAPKGRGDRRDRGDRGDRGDRRGGRGDRPGAGRGDRPGGRDDRPRADRGGRAHQIVARVAIRRRRPRFAAATEPPRPQRRAPRDASEAPATRSGASQCGDRHVGTRTAADRRTGVPRRCSRSASGGREAERAESRWGVPEIHGDELVAWRAPAELRGRQNGATGRAL